MLKDFLFTSESVSEGHPDKLCDQISDAILDAHLQVDPNSRVACEVLATTQFICVAGEITSKAKVDVDSIVREVARDIGYVDESIGLNADTTEVLVRLHEQSSDISQGVTQGQGSLNHESQGAGDQGMMFGYATNETPECMPAPIAFAHRILEYMSELRRKGELPGLLPDAKSQVSAQYKGAKISRLSAIVVSTQHQEEMKQKDVEEMVIEKVLKPVLPPDLLRDTTYLINPTGRFVIGGPHGDTGLTGRKIIVDTYGGWGRHGGGAFSGKDPSKVDRSAAYMARYCAKNIVLAGLAERCELQLSYAIGFPQPVSISLDTFGTGKIPVERILQRLKAVLDFSPAGIVRTLELLAKERCYRKTASYGHFGRKGVAFSWERDDRVAALQS